MATLESLIEPFGVPFVYLIPPTALRRMEREIAEAAVTDVLTRMLKHAPSYSVDRFIRSYLPAPTAEDEDEDDALTAYAEDMGAPADADPMNAMNAHSERIEQRLDELAARMSHIDTGTDIRITALEAARQEPTPSAPVEVTDAEVEAFCENYWRFWHCMMTNSKNEFRTDIRPALIAAFAVRDREVQDASN